MKENRQVFRSEEFIFTTVVFLVILFLLLNIVGLPFKARTFPLVISAVVLVLLAVQLVRIFRNAGAAGKMKGIPWKVPAGFGILFAAVGLGYLGGLPVTSAFLSGALCWLYGERRWWVILLLAAGGFALMYFFYGQLFRLPMFF